MIEQFVNRYPLSKTLRFGLIPQGNTEENFKIMQILEKDEALARNYGKAKEIIDRYHKFFINSCLADFHLTDLEKYALLYYEPNKTEEEVAAMDETAKTMRQAISGLFCKENKAIYDRLSKKDLIENFAMSVIETDEERTVLESFRKCTVYFTGFNQNRLNMYTGEGKSTEIAHRLINQNLPKFLDNARVAKTILAALPKNDLDQIDVDFYDIFGINTQNIFEIPFYNQTLTQAGIDRYNQIIGGYTCSDGRKIKGYNEYINHFIQETKQKLPKFKPLYKQILSDRETISFIPKAFQSDSEVLSALRNFYIEKNAETDKSIQDVITELKKLFQEMDSFDEKGIYITNGVAITDLSQAVCDNWFVIKKAMQAEYDAEHSSKNRNEDYEKKRGNDLKKVKSYSLSALQRYMDAEMEDKKSLAEYIKTHTTQLCDLTASAYERVRHLLETEYSPTKKLTADADAIGRIKDFLDPIMEVFHFAKIFLGSGEEAEKDDVFYGIFSPLYDQLADIIEIYDKVRNYVTQKPYKTDKIRLIFDRGDFLSGWAQPTESQAKEAHLMEKDGRYYLFITVTAINKADWERALYGKDNFQCAYHIEYYKQKPDNKNTPRLFIRSKGDHYAPAVEKYNLPIQEVIDLYDKGYYKAEFKKKDQKLYYTSLRKLIDYFKLGFTKHENYKDFAFAWKESDAYENITEFYQDTMNACYRLERVTVNWNGIMDLVEKGRGFLFQIYNKDFSDHTKGTPNLHTMYFKMLFDERNLENGCYRLLGGAEMFYRKASLKLSETTIHPKGVAIKNKNPRSDRAERVLDYDIIKDKRYTETQFSLHFPIMMNCLAQGNPKLNLDIRKALLKSEHQYIIGIDRGERNLLYVCVINEKGEIVEQMSLNEIIGDNGYTVDYHELLDRKEKERDAARKSWGTIENIKELKEGYMSQVIHKICELVLKYDAVIAMEDLNGGFMNSRIKIEKQVYQKFEKMLTEKLSYLVDKKADPMSDGGLLRAYQLTNKPDPNKSVQHGMQDGIVFYIPAWCTSKIDPTTGFVDLLKPKYTNKEEAKDFFKRFQKICFNEAENMFEFHFHYPDFQRGITAGNTDWTVYTNGSRIRTFRNPEKNNQWDNTDIVLTDAFKALFSEYAIPCDADMKEAILAQDSPKFFKELCGLLSLTLQMRNSITGRTDVDYIISPVKNAAGRFYDSRKAASDLPCDADANGAYNIARKVLLFIRRLQAQEESNLMNKDLEKITNAQWLSFVQNGHE